jgi:hypothetical protein
VQSHKHVQIERLPPDHTTRLTENLFESSKNIVKSGLRVSKEKTRERLKKTARKHVNPPRNPGWIASKIGN